MAKLLKKLSVTMVTKRWRQGCFERDLRDDHASDMILRVLKLKEGLTGTTLLPLLHTEICTGDVLLPLLHIEVYAPTQRLERAHLLCPEE